MTITLLFCTSPRVTTQDILDLNNESRPFPKILFNDFTPARSDPSAIVRPSKVPVELAFDIFDGASDAHLRELNYEFGATACNERGKCFFEAHFAVLDERGAKDKTVVFHSPYSPLGDELIKQPKLWQSWRVKWEDAHTMNTDLASTVEILFKVYLKTIHEFTNDDGVYLATEALKACRYIVEDKQPSDRPKMGPTNRRSTGGRVERGRYVS